jgi:hypothetical protein
MSKPVILEPADWQTILEKIKKKEKPSVYLSRSKMKEVLGFTVRDFREYIKDPDYVRRPQDNDEWFNMEPSGWFEGKKSEHTVRLDFYDDQKRTMFLLKYGNGKY